MSTNENLIGKLSVNTVVDHTNNQFKFVTASGALAAANGADALGVAQDAVAASAGTPKPLEIGYLGASKVHVNANSVNISVGDKITTASGGIGVTKTFGATDIAMGTALEASTADGDIIKVLLTGPATVA